MAMTDRAADKQKKKKKKNMGGGATAPPPHRHPHGAATDVYYKTNTRQNNPTLWLPNLGKQTFKKIIVHL